MQVSRSHVVPFARSEVWERLMDFDVIARALPGVESLEPLDDETSRITMKVLVPAITGSYEGTVKVVERTPVDSYRLRGDAKGRLGWVKGDAFFELREAEPGTEVAATMTFQTGGMLTGVGQRFMEGVAKGMLRELLESFERELVNGGER